MKKILFVTALIAGLALVAAPAGAAKHKKKAAAPAAATTVEAPAAVETPAPAPTKDGKLRITDFPQKGWHKGPYVAATVGMTQISNDKHIVTDQKFNGAVDPAFGIAFGYDIADWIGPLLQINFSTATGDIGDPNNAAAVTTYPAGSYPQYTFPAGTFPVESARQYLLDFSLFAKATLPYFTRAEWQPKMVKILPYAKLGGTATAMFVNSPTNANKMGAFGGGPAVGLGVEFVIWKGLFIAIDATEHLIFQVAYSRDITTANAGSQNLKLTKGGFDPHFTLLGMFGWHF